MNEVKSAHADLEGAGFFPYFDNPFMIVVMAAASAADNTISLLSGEKAN